MEIDTTSTIRLCFDVSLFNHLLLHYRNQRASILPSTGSWSIYLHITYVHWTSLTFIEMAMLVCVVIDQFTYGDLIFDKGILRNRLPCGIDWQRRVTYANLMTLTAVMLKLMRYSLALSYLLTAKSGRQLLSSLPVFGESVYITGITININFLNNIFTVVTLFTNVTNLTNQLWSS